MMKLNQKYIRLCGVNVYCEYELVSEKPPILLIHGFASSIYTFYPLIPRLQEHFSIIAMDLPGFGRSEKSASFVYSLENYAKVIMDCIEFFNVKEVHIAGHSMGGQIALYAARSHPERIKKLVLLSSSGYLKKANKAQKLCTYLPFFPYYVKKKVHSKNVEEYLENVFYNRSLITENHVKEYAIPLKDEGFYISLMRLLRYREGDLPSNELKNIRIPTLLLWGEEDKVVPVHIGYQLARDLPNAKLITYEKTGHLITEERSDEVYTQILAHTLF